MQIETKILSMAALGGSWFFVTGLIWKLFERVEKAATDEFKELTTSWIHNFKPENNLKQLTEMFGNSFDSVFDKKHFTWNCFLKSSIASFLCVIIVFLIWICLRPDEAYNFFHLNDFSSIFIIFFTFIIIFNFLPDYLSLLQTRLIIDKMKNNSKNHMAWLFADLVLTFLIAISMWLLILLLLPLVSEYERPPFSELLLDLLINQIFLLSAGERGSFSAGVPFYSTFFTSLWLWLYLLSVIISQITNSIDSSFNLVKKYLIKKDQPFISLGAISILLITFLYVLVIPVYLLIA